LGHEAPGLHSVHRRDARPRPFGCWLGADARPGASEAEAGGAAGLQEQAPTAESLGVQAFHPEMRYLESFDAGGGQRFYLFGANVPFADVVSFYQAQLKVKGDLVFDQPAIHMFDIGRYREETMAFPPSITVKDYTWGGMSGYPNPKPGAEPARFKTVVQIVPMPAGTPPQPVKK
jgi:hypothetical protein